jgi:photosystem II stability/assembly factor-like uncharacterized protein
VSVHSRPGHSEEIYVGTTFGLLISKDNGCSFRWVCEDNIGYNGTFDPKYEVASDGTLYATTYEGLRISRDSGCSFETATPGAVPRPPDPPKIWVDAIAVPPSGNVWVATADSSSPNDVHRSTDQGRTFASMGLQSNVVWYKSIKVARSDEKRIWVSGYQVAGTPAAHVYKSDNAGGSWVEVQLTGVVVAATPIVLLEAVEPSMGDTAYLRSVDANPTGGDILYRTVDGGVTWVEVLRTSDPIRNVVIRNATTVLVASTAGGLRRSVDAGNTFTTVANSPRTACLHEREDHQLLTCGTNWDPDFLSVGKSSDGDQWQKIFRFVDLVGPVQCPAGTKQADVCEAQLWPSLRENFGVVGPSCLAARDGPPGPQRDTTVAKPKGCCDSTDGAGPSLMLGLIVVLVAGRRRVTS